MEIVITINNGVAELHPTTERQLLEEYADSSKEVWLCGDVVKKGLKGATTVLQKGCLHFWFRKIAKACNEAGIELASVMPKKGMKVQVTEQNFKYSVFQPCLEAMYSETSSTKVSTIELSDCCKEIDNRLLLPQGLNVEWPSRDSLQFEMESKR